MSHDGLIREGFEKEMTPNWSSIDGRRQEKDRPAWRTTTSNFMAKKKRFYLLEEEF